jgi:hypothetical protein
MYIHLRRLGAAVLGLAVLGVAEGTALAQAQDQPAQPPNNGIRVGQAQPGVAGGVRAVAPGAGGFNFNAAGMPGGAYGMMTSSPYSGITSTPYTPLPPNPYGYGFNYDPYGGYLQGAASVIGSLGHYYVQSQQANLLKEQVRAAQMENRRRLFDEWLYERANTPTRQDELERTFKEDLRYTRFNPDKNEIWSGRALNVVLDDLKRIDRSRASGGNATVEENILKKINLTSGKGNANLGVLKNEGKIDWPAALLDNQQLAQEGAELRRQIQTLATKAYNEVRDNRRSDPGTVREIKESIKRLDNMLRNNVGSIEFGQYVDAKNYLKQLNDAVTLLTSANASDYVNGKFSLANLKNNTVAEIVKYMADNGLEFAPAVDGDREAYTALHRALANYDIAANSLIANAPTGP